MAKAKVSINEVVEFEELISSLKESVIDSIDGLCVDLSQWQVEIEGERQRCVVLQQRCQEECDAEERIIESIEAQIAAKEAQLAGMEPYIEVQHVDDDGETYTTLEENYAYTAIENEIRVLEGECAVHQRKLNRLQSVLYKIEYTIQTLDRATQELNEIAQELENSKADVEEYTERAEMLLDRVIHLLEEYLAVKIGGGSACSSSAGGRSSSGSDGAGNSGGNLNSSKKQVDTSKLQSEYPNLIDESINENDFEKIVLEMENNHVKFTKENLLFATKDKAGQIIFLETGKDEAGLKHIQQRHEREFFETFGVSRANIPHFLYKVVREGNLVDNHIEIRNGRQTITKVYDYEGNYYVLAGVGTNGFIVTARPARKG